ncbi:hypothetical protein VNO77_31051 [Canavalia gladiata]|uniref:Uncharacterized protein n=1 Tax=Canavalia gladiata TaxID=3824 RepID=A0AAN9Q3J5_CANGL
MDQVRELLENVLVMFDSEEQVVHPTATISHLTQEAPRETYDTFQYESPSSSSVGLFSTQGLPSPFDYFSTSHSTSPLDLHIGSSFVTSSLYHPSMITLASPIAWVQSYNDSGDIFCDFPS